jgi:hypothetical protein
VAACRNCALGAGGAPDVAGETRKALDALRTDPAYRTRYDDFVIAMAYGERPEFDIALASVAVLAARTWLEAPADGSP